jgi:hypothetical protein
MTIHDKFSLLGGIIQCVRKVAVHLGYGTYIWLSVSKLPLKCTVVSLHSVVKQRLKCNTGKVCNCLIQFLLTMVFSVEERVFLVEYVFREGDGYADLVQEQFALKKSQKHLYLVAMQFVDLLRSFVKQTQC